MREKNIDISKRVSKRYDPSVAALADWQVASGISADAHLLENQVMNLILELRRQSRAQGVLPPPFRAAQSVRKGASRHKQR